MFKNAYKLPFRLIGIPVYIDVTFLIIVPLFTWIIGNGIKADHEQIFGVDTSATALRQGVMPYVLGFISVLGLFISVVIHELGHALTARAYHVATRSITLWLLGGVAQLEEMPRRRGAEAVIAIVGPIVSFGLAGLLWLLVSLTSTDLPAIRFILKYLAGTNLILAIFNLLPALPLDGGRVLRSLLALRWEYLRATQISASVSRVLAVLLGVYGFLSGQLMLMLIAFFIFMAVNSETQQLIMEQLLRGVTVRDLMNRNVVTVSPQTTVAELMQIMIRERHKGFPVVDEHGQLVGIVELQSLHGVPPQTPVQQIMSPQVVSVPEYASAADALATMGRADFGGRMVVRDESGAMAGILTKTDLIRAIQVRLAAMQSGGDGMMRPRLAHT